MTGRSQEIRIWVAINKLFPAREAKNPQFEVNVLEVMKKMGLHNVHAQVVSALSCKKFLQPWALKLIETKGPSKTKISTSTTLVFEFEEPFWSELENQ